MILSSLCDYYKIMLRRGDVLPQGYSSLPMNYLISLTPEGEIDGILYQGTEENKKKVFPQMLLPLRSQKPGIEANIVEHRPLYLFGLVCERGVYRADDAKAQKSHAAFRESNLAFTEGLSSPVAQAYRNFILRWEPSAQCENPYLMAIAKDYGTARFAFCLSGRPDRPLHEEEEVKAKWGKLFASRKEEGEEHLAQCPVLGEMLPVARLHNKIKGIRNGQPSGCSLVCFNNASENSYGKEQSYNSSVSEEAMEQYTEALNFLLADERHCTVLGDMTIVHFALTAEEDAYLDCVNTSLFARTDRATAEDVDKAVSNTMHKIASGRTPSFDVPDAGVDYCIFGLMPNTSRVAIKFSYRNTFGELRKNVERYQEEFAIGKRTQVPPVWAICKQLVSPKAKENAAPELEGDILQSIVSGSPFPRKILEAVVRRVRVDSDPENNHFVKLNDVRAGLIKVCLSRKIKEEEKITMALNPQNKNAAYLCGRLFAVLEKVQQDSASGELNKTIKDSYFASACATPAVVFARLVQLSQNHLAKLEKGMQIYYNKLLGEIIGDLEEFPKALSLEEQGKFILGYYQQNAALYTKKENQSEGK